MEAENPEQPSNFMRRQQLLIEANERKYRPDFMAHFPFADEYGSIGDVLSGAGTFPEVDLDHMGAPGRNRLIVKVFEEMRLDQRGIRISDLPEALDVSESFQLLLVWEKLAKQISVRLCSD
jgi:hypothetical protein